ncbi:hypothetical protein LINPERHAP2_LOCUS28009 [Linum perenne]
MGVGQNSSMGQNIRMDPHEVNMDWGGQVVLNQQAVVQSQSHQQVSFMYPWQNSMPLPDCLRSRVEGNFIHEKLEWRKWLQSRNDRGWGEQNMQKRMVEQEERYHNKKQRGEDQERRREVTRLRWERLQEFNEFIAEIGVMDVESSGDKFTWCNNNRQGNLIKQCLDRCLCNGRWRELKPRSNVVHELRVQSDHSPIILREEGDGSWFGKRRFYYEVGWQDMEGYEEVVAATWERGNGTERNLGNCTKTLQQRKKETL